MQFRRVSGRDSAQVVTPFVQVGTSRDSPIAGGADYLFTSERRLDHLGRITTDSARIHPRREPGNQQDAVSRQVNPIDHQFAYASEGLEVNLLPGQ